MSPTAASPPAFCPSCGKGFATAGSRRLCDECGAGLLDRGYCPVCEGFLNAPAGGVCPKHDVLLEAGPEAAGPLPDLKGPWVEVARFGNVADCHPPRIRLEAEGIPTIVDGELAGSKAFHAAFSGGVVLRVPEGMAADARVILSQKWSDDALALGIKEEDDWDDEDFGPAEGAEPGPRASGRPSGKESAIWFWIVVITLGTVAGQMLINALGAIGR